MANPIARAPEPDEVGVRIDGQLFRYWDELELHLGLDSHASVGFTAPFEPERADFRSTFKPFSFKPLTVTLGGDLLFTGTLVDVNPRVEPGSRTVEVSAYARPAVLVDSDVPASALPLESRGLSIKQIAERLAAPFGLSVVMTAPEGAPFKKVRSKPDGSVHSYLETLTKQRSLVMSSTAKGELLIQQSAKTGSPVARLTSGAPPVVSVVPTFNPQAYYSEITGYVPARGGRIGSKYTEQNQRLAGGSLRTLSFRLDDTEKADAPAAVKAKMARMFGNMLGIVVEVPTWRDPKGRLWSPNTTLTLKAPDAMVYRETEFLIRDVFFRQKSDSRTAAIGLVLPGAFSGEQPARLPWDDSEIEFDGLVNLQQG